MPLPCPSRREGAAVKRGAVLSPCGTWRYELPREWGNGNRLVVVMLNPSTADAEKDDPTIRRVIGFAKSHGFGNLLVLNIFALRSTDPDGLRVAQDPVGPDNDAHIHEALLDPSGNQIVTLKTIEKGAYMVKPQSYRQIHITKHGKELLK